MKVDEALKKLIKFSFVGTTVSVMKNGTTEHQTSTRANVETIFNPGLYLPINITLETYRLTHLNTILYIKISSTLLLWMPITRKKCFTSATLRLKLSTGKLKA